MVDKKNLVGTIQYIDESQVKIFDTMYPLSERVQQFVVDKQGTLRYHKGQDVEYSLKNGEVSFMAFPKSEAKPIDKYPSKSEEREMADYSKQKIIVWQNMMGHATDIRAMLGGFPDPTDEGFEKISEEIVVIAYYLLKESERIYSGTAPAAVMNRTE